MTRSIMSRMAPTHLCRVLDRFGITLEVAHDGTVAATQAARDCRFRQRVRTACSAVLKERKLRGITVDVSKRDEHGLDCEVQLLVPRGQGEEIEDALLGQLDASGFHARLEQRVQRSVDSVPELRGQVAVLVDCIDGLDREVA